MIDGKNLSIFADLIENKMIINKKNKIKILSFSKNSLDASYLLEHKNILFEKRDIICEYNDALKITKFLDKINN